MPHTETVAAGKARLKVGGCPETPDGAGEGNAETRETQRLAAAVSAPPQCVHKTAKPTNEDRRVVLEFPVSVCHIDVSELWSIFGA